MQKAISRLTILIILIASFCVIVGIFSNTEYGSQLHTTVYDVVIETYGTGIYKNDSVDMAYQAIAQDSVTLFMGVPLLVISLVLFRKNLKGLFLLTGTLGYFLYTYMTFAFILFFNSLFLLYVIIMSCSLIAFILCVLLIAKQNINGCFRKNIKTRFIGGFMIFFTGAISLLWLEKIFTAFINNSAPAGIDHYSSLVIQDLDLGLLVPAFFIAGIFTLKRKPIGYMLSSILIMKGITLGTAITAMAMLMLINGVEMSPVEIIIFPMLTLFAVFCFMIIFKSIKEPPDYRRRIST
jgi:hypothetical protein